MLIKNKLKNNNNNNFILHGNNGASYIVNIKNEDALSSSLKFYKTITTKQKWMKRALKLYLFGLKFFSRSFLFCSFKTALEIEQYLHSQINQTANFELDDECSVLISSTRDKIIVHHHHRYFHKFAFGTSYTKVKNEANIYALFNQPLRHFSVSKFFDLDIREDTFCSFKLGMDRGESTDIDIPSALAELFDITKSESALFSVYLKNLKGRFSNADLLCEKTQKIFNHLEAHADKTYPKGLVHRDFKPWNINTDNGLLIYDFEEAITDGLPMEDLFNYHIDPIIRYQSASDVTKTIVKPEHIYEYKRYLGMIKTDIGFQPFLYCYTLERALFWNNAADQNTFRRYLALGHYLIEGDYI